MMVLRISGLAYRGWTPDVGADRLDGKVLISAVLILSEAFLLRLGPNCRTRNLLNWCGRSSSATLENWKWKARA